jgi:hypothetical protein
MDAAPHHCSPSAEPHPYGYRPLGSLLFHRWPNRVPHLISYLTDPQPHLITPLLAGIDAAVERLGAPLRRPQAERLSGLGREGRGQVGLARSNSTFSFFIRN